MGIITKLLDNDLYKFTMGQAVLHQYPGAMVEYEFKCRGGTAIPEDIDETEYIDKIKKSISDL